MRVFITQLLITHMGVEAPLCSFTILYQRFWCSRRVGFRWISKEPGVNLQNYRTNPPVLTRKSSGTWPCSIASFFTGLPDAKSTMELSGNCTKVDFTGDGIFKLTGLLHTIPSLGKRIGQLHMSHDPRIEKVVQPAPMDIVYLPSTMVILVKL